MSDVIDPIPVCWMIAGVYVVLYGWFAHKCAEW